MSDHNLPAETNVIVPEQSDDDDAGIPEYKLHDIVAASIEEVVASGVNPIAAFLKMRYAQDVRALVEENDLMKAAFLYVASLLEVRMPVSKLNQQTGEMLNYTVNITEGGVYNRQETGYIGILVKKKIDEHTKAIGAVNNTVQQLQNVVERQQIELKAKEAQIRLLSQQAKHATIDKKPYVLAYLGNKGNFLYLANKPRQDGKGTKLGKSLDFALAKKYNNPQEALVELITLLKNTNNTVPSAPKLQVFSANLIPATINIIPNNEDLQVLRERAEKYENLMKASHHGKRRKRKASNKS